PGEAMNCHVLVPDLFQEARAGGPPYDGLALPALETLIARGASIRLVGASLERWLAATFRIPPAPDLPLAALSLLGDGVDPGTACWMQADPVHLQVHRDQLLLAGSGPLDLTAAEAGELTRALSAHFAGDGLEFIAPAPEHWYVRVRDEPRVRTTPTAEAIGERIEPLLPQGEDGPRWRRIVNEAQMLLHGHPRNETREAEGKAPVNSVWLWGAGRMPAIPRDAPYGAVWSSHPLAAGIASAAGLRLHAIPGSGIEVIETAGAANGKPQLVILDALRAALA